MDKAQIIEAALQLPAEARLDLVEAIWESIEQECPQRELPAWQREILDQRLANDVAMPEDGATWEEVKTRILERL